MRSSNPFNKWKLGYQPLDAAPSNPGGGNTTPANHKTVGQEQLRKGSLRIPDGSNVNLPRNLYAPPSAQTLEIQNQASIPALTVTPMSLLTFTAPQDSMTQLISYAINTDGPGLTFIIPTINGFRVYPTHGLPISDFLISFPTGPDLGNNSLVSAQLPMKPGDVLEWFVMNLDVAAHIVAIRSSGYIMPGQAYEDTRFGG